MSMLVNGMFGSPKLRAVGPTVYDLNAAIVSDDDLSGGPAPEVAYIIRGDGTVRGVQDDGFSFQIWPFTDWCIPNEAAPTIWVRFTETGTIGLIQYIPGMSVGEYETLIGTPSATWHAVPASTYVGVGMRKIGTGTGTGKAFIDVDIATDSGGSTIIASANITLESILTP